MSNFRWFNASAPYVNLPGGRRFRAWNLFRRVSQDGRWWGVGLGQVGGRHLALIARTSGYPEREVWDAGLLFVKLDEVRRLIRRMKTR